MKSTEYIINRLEELVIRINNIRVRYEYDNYSLTHFIEVLPNSLYSLNQEYIEFEDRMFHEFISAFPYENICFISDDAIVKIEKPIFIKEGLGYAPFSIHQDTEFRINIPGIMLGSSTHKGDIAISTERDKTEIPFTSPIFCNIPFFNINTNCVSNSKGTSSNKEYALAA